MEKIFEFKSLAHTHPLFSESPGIAGSLENDTGCGAASAYIYTNIHTYIHYKGVNDEQSANKLSMVWEASCCQCGAWHMVWVL